jgi:hypothetical protein
MAYGALRVGCVVYGIGVAPSTVVTAFDTGSGGIGTYTVSPPQTIAREPMAAGQKTAMQPTEVTIQLDVHGPDSSDNAARISTLFRDIYAVDFIQAINPAISPFYADDPKQIPFVNDQNQYEWRWVVDARMQVNETISEIPQQFADQLSVGLIEVDSTYPA